LPNKLRLATKLRAKVARLCCVSNMHLMTLCVRGIMGHLAH